MTAMYTQNVVYTLVIDARNLPLALLSDSDFEELTNIAHAVCKENLPEGAVRGVEVWQMADSNADTWMLRGAVPKKHFTDLRKALGGVLISKELVGSLTIRLEQMREGSHTYIINGPAEDVYTLTTVGR